MSETLQTTEIKCSRIKLGVLTVYLSFFVALFLVLLEWGTRGLFQFTVRDFNFEMVLVWFVLLCLWLVELFLIFAWLSRIRYLFVSQPRLTLDHRGLTDKWLGVGLVDWVDIKRIELYGITQIVGIALYLNNRQKYVDRMSRWDRFADRLLHPRGGGGKLVMHYGCFKGRAATVYKLIKQHRKFYFNRIR